MQKCKKKETILFFGICVCFIIFLTVWNYYPQSGIVEGYSDTKYHAEWSKALFEHNPAGYDKKILSYPLFFWISGLFGAILHDSHLGIVGCAVVFSVLSYVTVYLIITRCLRNYERFSSTRTFFFSLMLSYSWPIDLSFELMRKKIDLSSLYLRAFATNPAHNLTVLAPKACSIVVVILFMSCFHETKIIVPPYFKKYYQRIYKSTGAEYLEWVEEIQQDLWKEKMHLSTLYEQDQFFDIERLKNREYTRVSNLYIFGHSLDVTDKDVLKALICNDNVQTHIFYYRETHDDRRTLKKLVANLAKVIGPEELIRRTGGPNKTIEFIPQTVES